MSGWADLGDIVSGGVGNAAQDEYAPQLKRNYDAFAALEEAKIKRSQAMARESLPQAIQNLGYRNGADMATILNASSTVDMRRLGNNQNPYYMQAMDEAQTQIGLGDIGKANDQLILAQGKPVATQATMGAGNYTQNKYHPDSPIELTPLGETVASKNNAATGLTNAKVGTEGERKKSQTALTEGREASTALAKDKKENPDKYKTSKATGSTKTKDKIYNPKTGKIE